VRGGTSVRILSRNRRTLEPYFPEVASAAVRSLPEDCSLDGEPLGLRDGEPQFSALLERCCEAVVPAARPNRVPGAVEALSAGVGPAGGPRLGSDDGRVVPNRRIGRGPTGKPKAVMPARCPTRIVPRCSRHRLNR
jgi:hypothetical protein